MARKSFHNDEQQFRLADWMALKGIDDKGLADELGVADVTVWRWRNGDRTPNKLTQARIAQKLDMPDWRDLWKTPAEAGAGALLGGLPDAAKRDALDYIEALRKRHR